MTNEEIRKRFQFDLEVGVFKKIEFETYFLIKRKDLCFIDFLIDIGYFFTFLPSADALINQSIRETNEVCMVLNEATKEINPTLWRFKEYFNDVPDYIKEYKIKNDE